MDVTIDKPLENIGKNIPVRKKKITQEQQKSDSYVSYYLVSGLGMTYPVSQLLK